MVKRYHLFIIVVFTASILATISHSIVDESKSCPTWYQLNSVGKCKCLRALGIIRCEKNGRIMLKMEHCITYDNISNVISVGTCPFSHRDNIDDMYVQLPANVNELNNFTCGRLKRRGLLCSNCEDSLGVAVLSYSHECTKCLGNFQGWLLYSALALIPITLFFLIVVFFNIHATSAHMNALICIAQIILYKINSDPGVISKQKTSLARVGLTILGIWNLDFFRYIYPPFCISTHFLTLQVLAFEYIIAFYPLLLIIITYIGIELYDNNYRVIVLMWKPFSWCLSHIKTYLPVNLESAKSNIINTFASFLVFSYSKILFTCYSLISYTKVYQRNGSHPNITHSYYSMYNASTPYLGPQHKPYFILAVIILTVFNIFPMLLMFAYPTTLFQKTLGCFPRVDWHFLHTFMDYFQGCYKNGTNNTRDYRYIAGMYLLIRIFYHIPDILSYNYYNTACNFLMPLAMSLIFGILRPYHTDTYNRLDCALFGLLTFARLWGIYGVYIIHMPIIVMHMMICVPIFYTIFALLNFIALPIIKFCYIR